MIQNQIFNCFDQRQIISRTMGDSFQVVTLDFVNLEISTSENFNVSLSRRFPKSITIAEFKGKLELQTGGNASTMSLELYNKDNELVSKLDDNSALLGSYNVEDGMRIHVIDKFILRNEFENVSKVEKYDISDELYEKRIGTVKSYLQKNKLGKYNEEDRAAKEEEKQKFIKEQMEIAKKFKIGERCQITVPGKPVRRATIKYIGEIDNKAGYWVGVQYDEPLGSHNGTFNNKTYFTCPDKYGAFTKPCYVEVGDFPEENDLEEI